MKQLIVFILYCFATGTQSEDDQKTDPMPISVSNFTCTSVLVEWTGGLEITVYTVKYMEIPASVQLNNLPALNSHSDDDSLQDIKVEDTSVVLVELKENTKYCVSIWENESDILCTQQFLTCACTPQERDRQIKIVRVYVYNPVLNSDCISAQVIWNDALDPPADRYDVRVITADKNMADITGESLFNLSQANVNIITRTKKDTILYPLETNRLYIVQVRRRTDQIQDWSEPSWINTKNTDQQKPLLLISTSSGLKLFDGQNELSNMNPLDIQTPVAIDKVNLVIFYIQGQYIMKGSISGQLKSIPFFNLNDNHDVISMVYDWVSRRLYMLLARKDVDNNAMLCYLLDIFKMKELSNGELLGCTNISIVAEQNLQLAINPFTGNLHWVRQNRLEQLSLQTFVVSTVENNVSSSTLAENILSGCVHVIRDDQIRGIAIGDDECFDYSVNVSFSGVRLAIDEKRVYFSSNSSVFYYVYNDAECVDTIELINNILSPIMWFDIVSPGSQVFPNQPCVSPIIFPLNSKNIILNVSSTSFYLEWTTPNMTRNNDCDMNVSSTPPLLYQIDITDTNDQTTMSFETYQTSLNIMTTIPLVFNVTLRAGTDFIVNADAPILAYLTLDRNMNTSSRTTVSTTTRPNMSTSNRKTVSTATRPNMSTSNRTTVSTATSRSLVQNTSMHTTAIGGFKTITMKQASFTSQRATTTTTSTSTTPPSRPVSDNTIVIAAGIGGGVALIITLLVGVIIVITAIICVRSRKSYTMSDDSARYVRRDTNGDTSSGHYYMTDMPQPVNTASDSVPTNDNSIPTASPYESPLTLSNRPLLASGSSTEASVAPYAIPADSLQEYRRTSQVPSTVGSMGQEYEVPTTSTLPNRNNVTDNDNTQPTLNVYSTLDDAANEKQRFSSTMDANSNTLPPDYSSLIASTMDRPHSYEVTTTPITQAPELYSEPIASPKRYSKSKVGTLPPQLPTKNTSFDNPTYESQPSATRKQQTYSTLERSIEARPQSHSESNSQPNRQQQTYSTLDRSIEANSRSHSESNSQPAPTYSTVGPVNGQGTISEPTYFELEKPHTYAKVTNSKPNSPRQKRPGSQTVPQQTNEPTYFTLERELNNSDATKTGSVFEHEPTYFELEKSKPVLKHQPDSSSNPASKQMPTYFQIEPSKDTLQFQLEENVQNFDDEAPN